MFVAKAHKLSCRGRRSGGVIFLVKNCVGRWIEPVTCSFNNILLLKVNRELLGTVCDVILVGAYIPPVGSTYYDDKDESNGILVLEKCLLHVSEKFPECCVIICGDLNARTGRFNVGQSDVTNWKDDLFTTRLSQDNTVNEFGETLLSVCMGHDLCVGNGCIPGETGGNFTNISPMGNSVVDYFLVTRELLPLCSKLEVKENVLTSHLCLELTMTCNVEMYLNSEAEEIDCYKLIWDPNLGELFQNELVKNFEDMTLTMVDYDVDEVTEKLIDCYVKAAEGFRKKILPCRRRRTNPWFDKECRLSKKMVRCLLRKYISSQKEEDRVQYCKERNLYKQMVKCKKTVYKKEAVTTLVTNLHNQSIFWKNIKKYNAKSYVNGRIEKVVWREHFKALFEVSNAGNDSIIEDGVLDMAIDFSNINDEITEGEVLGAINRLKLRAASGSDEILPEMMKCTPRYLINPIVALFNQIFTTSKYPKVWNKSIVIPIYKKGDPSVPDNYRGISLTSCFSKVFTCIITDRLNDWVETNNLLGEEQAGFRRGYSTIDNVFVLHSIIQRYLLRRRKVYVAFVDLKKAFDRVDRKILWEILGKYGLEGRLLEMVKAIYHQVQCCVRCNNTYGDVFECNCGLKQGCKMSPILFSLLVNYVAKYVAKNGKHGIQLMPDYTTIYALLYADDIALVADTVTGLQNQLKYLEKGTRAVGLQVNNEKTKVIVFRNGGYLADHEKWYLGLERLETVNEYRYLGTLFTTRLSVNNMQSDLVQRARGAMMQVSKCLRKLNCVSPDVFFRLFDAQVQSVLLYGCELWGISQCYVVELVHLQAIKSFLDLPRWVPNLMVYGDTGRYPLYITASLRAIKYWLRVLKMDSFRYPRKAYNMMLAYEMNENWASKIKETLCRYGFSEIWVKQEVRGQGEFLKEIRKRMVREYNVLWAQTLYSSERYSFYRSFKTFRVREGYLYILDKKVFRDIYIRFRMGYTNLYVHKYRYVKESDFNTYLCPACYETDESETHFLLECPVYEDLRKKFLRNLPNVSVETECLLMEQDTIVVRSVARFLYYAFKRREEAVATAVTEEAYTT